MDQTTAVVGLGQVKGLLGDVHYGPQGKTQAHSSSVIQVLPQHKHEEDMQPISTDLISR